MPSPTAFGYEPLTDQTRHIVWEHPRTGHIIEARGGVHWDVSEVRPGANTSEILKTGMTRDGAVEYAGRVARSAEPGGTPSDFDIGGGL